MESKDVGQLLQVLSEARSAGVLGDVLKSMDVQKGCGSSMNDSSKTRVRNSLSLILRMARVGSKCLKLRPHRLFPGKYWGKIYGKENVKITIPDGMSVNHWGKTPIDMKKFAKLGASYEQAVALSYQWYVSMTSYLHWIMQTYGGKIGGGTQAYDLGKYLPRIRFTAPTAKKSGFRRVFVD